MFDGSLSILGGARELTATMADATLKHAMSRGAQAVLQAFDQLAPGERDEVLQALLRRLAESDHQSFSDDELVAGADTLFSAYDDEEESAR